MTTITATEARKQLYKLLDDVSQSHEPIQITGKRGNAVLIAEADADCGLASCKIKIVIMSPRPSLFL
jgi:hypothetical protein